MPRKLPDPQSKADPVPTTPWLGFSIDRTARQPVFEQICAAIRARVVAGDLPAGTRLPPTRVFATELGVSRSTVVTAYDQLVAEGYLIGRQGSGFVICALGEVELAVGRNRRTSEPQAVAAPPLRAFEASQPDMRLFPHRQWAKAVARVCRTDPQALLRSGPAFGNPALRQAIAAHVAEWRGLEASPHQIIVTAGSGDALELCLHALMTPGDRIGLEDPGYLPMRRYALSQGLQVVPLGLDDQGARLPVAGQAAPRLVMLTPSHQYPLGGAMSPSRRLEYLGWARAQDGWILEDDYDSEFRYAGRPIPAMAGFDRLDRTLYAGSFSKIFSTGLRIGYVIVPAALLGRFAAALRQFGARASLMPQQALAEFMASGEFYRHLRRVRRIYGDRRRFLLDRLRRDFDGLGWCVDHQAGMQLVFHLAEGWRDTRIADRAAQVGVEVRPLSAHALAEGSAASGGAGTVRNGLILGFCGYDEAEMAPALDRLRSCFDPAMNRKP